MFQVITAAFIRGRHFYDSNSRSQNGYHKRVATTRATTFNQSNTVSCFIIINVEHVYMHIFCHTSNNTSTIAVLELLMLLIYIELFSKLRIIIYYIKILRTYVPILGLSFELVIGSLLVDVYLY